MRQDDEYRRRFDAHLQAVADGLEELVRGHLTGAQDIDSIRSRAKTPASFAAKAERVDEHGRPEYSSPLTDIQDQVGVLVVVLYKSTVETVWALLERYFTPIEETAIVPESHWEFGYFGRHGVMAMPHDVIPAGTDPAEVPRFFEVQIKTL